MCIIGQILLAEFVCLEHATDDGDNCWFLYSDFYFIVICVKYLLLVCVQQRQGGGEMMGGMGRGRGRAVDNRFGGEWGPGGNRFDGSTYVIPADKCGLVIGKGKLLHEMDYFY